MESVIKAVPGTPLPNPHSGGHWRPWVNRSIASAFERELRGLNLVPAKPGKSDANRAE